MFHLIGAKKTTQEEESKGRKMTILHQGIKA